MGFYITLILIVSNQLSCSDIIVSVIGRLLGIVAVLCYTFKRYYTAGPIYRIICIVHHAAAVVVQGYPIEYSSLWQACIKDIKTLDPCA